VGDEHHLEVLARPRHEPLTLLAGVAGRTKRVKLGTAVLLPMLRNPVLLAHQVGEFFTDLRDPRMVSAIALAHQRFSTNTFPTWDLAHPFRFIAHNGEINTLQGNLNWIRSRQATIHSKLLGEDLDKIWPLIYDGQSDSASFDNALELLLMGGYPIHHAMMLMIPEAWAGNPLMDAKRRAFYEYHAALMEPWDGPAAVAFTDGKFIGATLDQVPDVSALDGPVLVPGVGAQGGRPEALAGLGGARPGQLLPAVSREILRAGPDPAAIRAAGDRLRDSVAYLA
jgi:hypothetical protein